MEAANLGAYLADRSEGQRDDAVQALAETPGYAADQAGYLQVAVGSTTAPKPGSIRPCDGRPSASASPTCWALPTRPRTSSIGSPPSPHPSAPRIRRDRC
jgi:hypothetical protein